MEEPGVREIGGSYHHSSHARGKKELNETDEVKYGNMLKEDTKLGERE